MRLDITEADKRLWQYNANDCETQEISYEGLKQWIDEDGTAAQHAEDMKLAAIARRAGQEMGLHVDLTRHAHLQVELHSILDDLKENLQRAARNAGWKVKTKRKKHPEFNPRSTYDVSEILFRDFGLSPKLNTKGHKIENLEDESWSTSIPALFALQETPGLTGEADDFIKTLIEFRTSEALRKQFVDNLKPHPTVWDEIGQIFVSYQVHRTPSGRWASSPNVQNWPTQTKFNMREMIVAPPGHVLISCDFEQIDARVYAVVANDQMMLKAIHEDLDLHILNYCTLITTSEDELWRQYRRLKHQKDESAKRLKRDSNDREAKRMAAKVKQFRLVAKRFCFLEIYGGRPAKLYETMRGDRDKMKNKRTFASVSIDDCIEWHKAFHEWHPETRLYHRRCDSALRRQNYVTAGLEPGGRKRWFIGGPAGENEPRNHPVQSKSSEFQNDSIMKLSDAIGFKTWSEHTGLVNQVHDEILWCVPEDRANEACDLFRQVMDYDYRGVRIYGLPEVQKRWTVEI